MELGIGLPNACCRERQVASSSTGRAPPSTQDSRPSGPSTRIVYPSYEPLIALSAAAAVTERIRLATDVMLGPAACERSHGRQADPLPRRPSRAAARAVLGIGLGAREDDYEVSGVDMSTRGAWPRLRAREDPRNLETGTASWRRRSVHGRSATGPSLLVGGYVETAIKRAARFGDGWTQGGFRPGSVLRGPEEAPGGLEGGGPRRQAQERWRSPISPSGPTPSRTHNAPWPTTTSGGGGSRPGDCRQRSQGRRHSQGLHSRSTNRPAATSSSSFRPPLTPSRCPSSPTPPAYRTLSRAGRLPPSPLERE